MKFEDFQKQQREHEELRKKHFIQSFFISIYDFFRYRICHIIDDAKYEVKWGFQRMFRGYDDTAFWSLDRYLLDIILPVLKEYRENGHGIAIVDGFEEKPFEEQEKEWHRILDSMINSFQMLKEDDEDFVIHDKEWYEKHYQQIQEGLQLFAKHYQTLWD